MEVKVCIYRLMGTPRFCVIFTKALAVYYVMVSLFTVSGSGCRLHLFSDLSFFVKQSL